MSIIGTSVEQSLIKQRAAAVRWLRRGGGEVGGSTRRLSIAVYPKALAYLPSRNIASPEAWC